LSVQAIAWVLDHSKSKLADRLVLLAIANHCDRYGRDAWPLQTTIAAEAYVSTREVVRAIQKLDESGELRVENGKGEIGRNRYSLPGMEPASIRKEASDNLALSLSDNLALSEPSQVTNPTILSDKSDIAIRKNRPEPSNTNINTSTFKKPSLEDVACYCLSRQNGLDPEKWFDYYQSNGWRVGRAAMRDWQAAVRTWEKNNYGKVHRQETFGQLSTGNTRRAAEAFLASHGISRATGAAVDVPPRTNGGGLRALAETIGALPDKSH
jgi:hypothetical protein